MACCDDKLFKTVISFTLKFIKQPFLLYLYSFGGPKKQRGREIIPWSDRKIQNLGTFHDGQGPFYSGRAAKFSLDLRAPPLHNPKKGLFLCPCAKKMYVKNLNGCR